MSKSSAGKGDMYRRIDSNKFRKNWDLIFNKPKKKKVNKKETRHSDR